MGTKKRKVRKKVKEKEEQGEEKEKPKNKKMTRNKNETRGRILRGIKSEETREKRRKYHEIRKQN